MTYIDEIINYGLQADMPPNYVVIINSFITLTTIIVYFINIKIGAAIAITLFCLFLINALSKRNLRVKDLFISATNFTILAVLILILQQS